MNLEIKGIYCTDVDDYLDDPHNFVVHLHVDIGEEGVKAPRHSTSLRACRVVWHR